MKVKEYLSQNTYPKNLPHLMWILPVFHLLLATICHQKIGYFFLNSKDPEYFHLMSGVAMSVFRLDTGYIDHPGIPIQIIVAIASRITFWLSDSKSVIHDVIQHPEVYVFVSNLLFNLVFAFIIFIIGLKATKYSKDLRVGLLLQLSFFANMYLITFSGRLVPDGFMLMPLGLLFLVTIKYLYDEAQEKNWRRYLIQYSILVGWGVATKLSFAPFALIPLIILPGFKKKASFIGISILAFFIIAFPVLSHLNYFWDWTSNMFIHSGQWGHGEADFINLAKVPERINALYGKDKMVFILSIILLIETIILKLSPFRPNQRFKRYLKVNTAILGGLILMIIFIVKHFAWYYYVSAMLFKSLLIFLVLWPLFFLKNHFVKQNHLWLGVAMAFLLMVLSIHNLAKSWFSDNRDHQMDRIVKFQSQVNQGDVLILSPYYAGAPFKQYGLAAGALMSGPAHKVFKKPLLEKYPNTYIYYGWANNFFHWFNYVSSKDILKKDKPIHIYIGKGKDKDLDIILKRFRKENQELSFDVKQVVSSKHGGDKLYRMQISGK